MTIENIKSVAVIGTGTMGQGIAQVCAASGYSVTIYDVQQAYVEKALVAIAKNLDALVTKGKLTTEDSARTLSAIATVDKLEKVNADLAIEAVVESLEIKQQLFSALEKTLGDNCILTTNTSSIPVTQIGSALKFPHRFAGLHFFNPAPIMKLVEVVTGTATSRQTIDTLFSFSKSIGKQAVLAQDSPGFIVNRVARHFYVESLKALEENVADHESIDKLMRATGFKMGPFELMDLIGVDVNFSVTSSMFNAFHEDPKFRPSRIQQQKVDAGHHGRKSGKGFYDYR